MILDILSREVTRTEIKTLVVISLSASALLSCPRAAGAQTTDLYVANRGTNSIAKVSPGGAVTTFVSAIGGEGMAFDTAGNLYVNNGNITKITPAGVESTIAPGVPAGYGLVFGPDGNLYASDTVHNAIDRITLGGVVSTFATGLFVPDGLAFDGGGNLYVSNAQAGNNTISKITPGGVVSFFAAVNAPLGLAFDPTGNLYAASQSGTINRITPGGAVSTFVAGLSVPYGLAFGADGNMYVATNSNGAISKITPGGVVTTFATGLSGPTFVAFAPSVAVTAPEASPLALVALGGIASVSLLRRRLGSVALAC